MPKVFVLHSFFLPAEAGGHTLFNRDDEVELPEDLAKEMARAGRVRYMREADIPTGVGGKEGALVTRLNLSAAAVRRRLAEG